MVGTGVGRNDDLLGRDTDFRSVRSWAKAHGYEVGQRGRIAHDVLAAYNSSNGTNVVDHSGRPSSPPATSNGGSSKGRGRSAHAPEITAHVFVVDEDGVSIPFHPDLLLPHGLELGMRVPRPSRRSARSTGDAAED